MIRYNNVYQRRRLAFFTVASTAAVVALAIGQCCLVVDAMSVAVQSKPSQQKPHVLCVGVAAVDFVATVDHYPTPNEKMRSTSLIVEGGGNAANTACSMGRLDDFITASLVTAVGADANGQTIVSGLREYNVQTDRTLYTMPESESTSPFTYIFTTDVDGDSTRTCIHQPASGDLSVNHVKQLDLKPYTALHFDGRYPQAAVALSKRCVQRQNDDGTMAEIPYSIDVERPREGLLDLLSQASIVICNADYCNAILKNDTTDDEKNDNDTVATRLRKVVMEQAPRALLAVQTLGSQGACLIRLDDSDSNAPPLEDGVLLQGTKGMPSVTIKDGALYCEAFAVEKVVDTTGAGDSFQGGFLTALWTAVMAAAAASTIDAKVKEGDKPTTVTDARSQLAQLDPRVLGHALRIASRVASEKVQQPGARRGLPSSATDAVLQAEFESLLQVVSQQTQSRSTDAATAPSGPLQRLQNLLQKA